MTYLSDERRDLRDETRSFAMTEVLPLANTLDPQRADIPRAFLGRLAERGYFGITIPREYGGMGLGVFEYCLVAEELARGWMSVASIIARGNGLLDQVLSREEQRRRILPRMARGEFIGAFALSEPEAGSDVANLSTLARRDGDAWVIDGEKKWVGFARRADFILLFARTTPIEAARARHDGISCFLVEKERDAFPDGMTGEPIDKIGYFGLTTWRLSLQGLRLPASALVGKEGDAFAQAMQGLNRKRVFTAARSIGVARGALEDACEYVQQRRQFDRPLAAFQSLRFKLADMATDVEAARGLMYAAAAALDAHTASGAPRDPSLDREAAMAKLFAGEMAERVTSEAMQIFGGNGYTTEHAVQRYWRDARLTKIIEGTSEIQRRIIADRLLDD